MTDSTSLRTGIGKSAQYITTHLRKLISDLEPGKSKGTRSANPCLEVCVERANSVWEMFHNKSGNEEYESLSLQI